MESIVTPGAWSGNLSREMLRCIGPYNSVSSTKQGSVRFASWIWKAVFGYGLALISAMSCRRRLCSVGAMVEEVMVMTDFDYVVVNEGYHFVKELAVSCVWCLSFEDEATV
jgi:hypothetical protein